MPLAVERFEVFRRGVLWLSLPLKGASICPPRRSFAWCAMVLLASQMIGLTRQRFPEPMFSGRRLPCSPAPHLRCSPVRRNEPRAMYRPSTAWRLPLVIRRGARSSIQSRPRHCGLRSQASCDNSSAARRWNRCYALLSTPASPSMAAGMAPLSRCTVRRVCQRSTATGLSPLLTSAWERRFSIRIFVQ